MTKKNKPETQTNPEPGPGGSPLITEMRPG